MNSKISRLLQNKGDNYILPFFWQHGEDEATLRHYMDVIHKANIGAVCVESRPHPDYCGPKWWADMDVILDEARKRDMKVWILDDSHFPTGFANGAMKDEPDELRRQSIAFRRVLLKEGETFSLSAEELRQAGPFVPNELEKRFSQGNAAETKIFTDDRLLGIAAVRTDHAGGKEDGAGCTAEDLVDLEPFITAEGICWKPEEGSWKIYILNLTRNRGPHRNYINMLDRRSVRVLIDAVYEPHFKHYQADFGKTIAGFFSDEPELGNGHLYEKDNQLGCYDDQDYPWSAELEELLKDLLGSAWPNALAFLWDNEAKAEEKARIRYTYMDCVTRLVEKDFSWQLGDWCRSHGVKYIGHLIEDNNQHARTGSSLGHYFRGLGGEDWSGVDDIGGQVMPQGEDLKLPGFFSARDGEFYHYMLGKLASSAAAIEPLKQGNSMCEIFGAYGWGEGVRLEKYLIDHLLVRGINHYVPHAFSPKAYPDPDCPPHFYAHGHNPQYRHFGKLMAYSNRVCELISGGKHIAPAAILYHGEAEWMGRTTFGHLAGRRLADAQIEYDYIPSDVFEEPQKFNTRTENGTLSVNGQEYRLFIVPEMEFITRSAALGLKQMKDAGVAVVYVNAAPKGIGNTLPQALSEIRKTADAGNLSDLSEIGRTADAGACRERGVPDDEALWNEIRDLPAVPAAELPAFAAGCGAVEIRLEPADSRIRYIHYVHEDRSSVYFFVNEGTAAWKGSISIPELAQADAGNGAGKGGTGEAGADPSVYLYDAWENRLFAADTEAGVLHLTIEPLKSKILVIDRSAGTKAPDASDPAGAQACSMELSPETAVQTGCLEGYEELAFEGPWKRSFCENLKYPDFGPEKEVVLPDTLAEEEPLFSGIVRYGNRIVLPAAEDQACEDCSQKTLNGRKASDVRYLLAAEDAAEALEVFVNGKNLGIRIAPPFRYDLTEALVPGENTVVLEVATTLEREASQFPGMFGMKMEPKCGSGLTGEVRLYRKIP